MRRPAEPRNRVLSDGTPYYVLWAEDWLIGGAMLVDGDAVDGLPVTPHDFYERELGVVWKAILNVRERGDEQTIPVVAAELDSMGWLDRVGAEPRLVDLAGDALNYLVAATDAGIKHHASIVHEWGEKRRKIRDLSEQAKAVYAGASNVVPITRATGVRPFIAS